MKRVLFISHDASRTGATLVLLNLLKYFKDYYQTRFDILLINGGVLLNEFELLGETFLWHKAPESRLISRIVERFLPQIYDKVYKRHFLMKFRRKNYSLIYANTVVSVGIASYLKRNLRYPSFILHIHELEYAIRSFIGIDKFAANISTFDHFITVCNDSKEYLTYQFNMKPEQISVIPSFPNPINIPDLSIINNARDELGLSKNTFIIGASGVVHWIKGADLFLSLANIFYSRYPALDVLFLWVGKISESEKIKVNYDLNKLGLVNKVKFIGERKNPITYFSLFDVFVLVSREDSFPLVCLENAALSKPIICFDKSGGITDFIGPDAGIIVPYCAINQMADKVYLLYQDQSLRMELGEAAKRKLNENYSRIESLERIYEIIKDYMV